MVKRAFLPDGALPVGDVTRLTGHVTEHILFERLQLTLGNKNIKDTLVLSSWSDKGAQDRKNREFDFIIVSLPLKFVFQIEVKSSSNKPNINKAIEQVEEGRKFLSSIIPFPAEDNWKFVRSFYFGKLTKPLKPCQSCHNFLLSHDTNLDEWWDGIAAEPQEEPNPESDGKTYLRTVKYLLFQMFLQGDCITKGQI